MFNYGDYLSELKTTTLFRDMTDEEILLVLNSMQPAIKKGGPEPQKDENGTPKFNSFRMVLRSNPVKELAPRYFKYDMPRYAEPGMLMAEIPALSSIQDYQKPKQRPNGGPHHKGNYELETLEFTPEMITKYYNPETAPAQGKMLRNLLGILSQKVCDIRQEYFLLKDGRDSYDGMTIAADKILHIKTAGVAMGIVQKAVKIWNAMHPELPAECKGGGSVDLINQVKDGALCDVLILADETIIESMLMPEYTSGYRIFAGNKMVILGLEKHSISSDNWKETLLSPDVTFGHFNPYGDPGGYRAVMSLLLADKVEDGLSAKLMNDPGHKGMDRDQPHGQGPAMYTIGYYTMAVSKQIPFAELPAAMNLSDESLRETYATVHFDIDEKNSVTATPISHALTIMNDSKNKKAAQDFCRLFLNSDFQEAGFLKREGVYGIDPLS